MDTEFYKCPECGQMATSQLIKYARYDFTCPCGKYHLSDYVKVPAPYMEEGAPAGDAAQQKGGSR